MRESGRLKRPCGASRRLEAREFIHVSLQIESQVENNGSREFIQVKFGISQIGHRRTLARMREEDYGYSPSERVDRYSLTRP